MATSAPPPVRRLHFGDNVALFRIEHHVGAHAFRHFHSHRIIFDTDNECSAHQLRARSRTKPNRALGKNYHRIANADVADSAPLKPVDAMSASNTTCSSVNSSGILARLA